ncbi:MAG: DUF3110 domain-containing protein [Moorea sp. SIO2B7]|nr:DUF3110 domain-containing protein [Moorena sp. SIO2B7]
MRVFILLFNARTENEGIHTIQLGDRNTVLMFINEDDATRFALMLEAQDFPTPTVEAMESEDIEEFCAEAGYEGKIVEEGQLAVPPEKNIEETDWDPEGKKQIPESESESESESEMESSELDRIRRQLEGLL